jgi:pyruvate dehydrogenase E1 component alpha subunit
MQKARKFEEMVATLFEQNRMRGSVHIGIGQEAILAGAIGALRETDYIIPSHRGHGEDIAKGTHSKYLMAELFGKETGVCRGRGGTAHMADMSKRNLGVCAIIGGSFCNAIGAGLAIKMDKKDDVMVVFFGDGAQNQGTFHESLNMAAIWKLPVVFLCENNGYAITVPFTYATAVDKVSKRAASYDMPGVTVDGNDVFAVYDAVTEAAERARQGHGPSIVECVTGRWKGHWLGDPEVYRCREEVACWIEKCPILRLEKALLDQGIATKAELEKLEAEARAEIDEAIRFAEESPDPDVNTVMDDVFVEAGR